MLSEKQLEELYNKLSFDEKIGELLQLSGDFFGVDGEITGNSTNNQFLKKDISHCGSILNTYGVKQLSLIQKKHLEEDKVPMIFMGDVTAGYSASQPIPLAQACSFNPKLVEGLCRSAAESATCDGVTVTFSPMVDISRDARWGRVAESYGEDTYLSSAMAEAAVKGYQGDSPDAIDTMSSCVKHFASYGYPEGGIDYNNVELSERTLKEEFLPPYKSAVNAGCDMVMSSFNSIGGIPVSINPKLLKNTLRDEWGFKGVIISDWASLLRCQNKLRAVNCERDIAYYASKSTVDIDMADNIYSRYYKELLDEGIISEEDFKNSVMRVLKLKNKQGILEDPYKYLSGRKIDFEKHYNIAKNAVYETLVLLENKSRILPLRKDETVALIGPYAVRNRAVSMWSKRHRPETDSIIKMPKEAFENALGHSVSCEPGCPILSSDTPLAKAIDENDICYENQELYLEKAIKTASTVDKVVLMIGEHLEQGGETCSKSSLKIEEVQIELLKRIYEVNKNIICIVFSARPISLVEVKKYSKSIVLALMPGDAGNEAIADVICGKVVPSGKLAMSIPYSSGQCPMRYGSYQDGSNDDFQPKFRTRYVDSPIKPMYSFGFGLSYSTFEYSPVNLSSNKLLKGETILAKVSITNSGIYDAFEVVQMYLQDEYATLVSRPFKELKGFEKVFIKAGETIDVSFEIDEKMLRFYNYNMEYSSEKGLHNVFIGSDSDTKNLAQFEFFG